MTYPVLIFELIASYAKPDRLKMHESG